MKKYIAFLLLILCLLTGISSAQDWVQLNGPSGEYIRSIAQNSKGDIFVGTSTLHRSTDGGKTWVCLRLNEKHYLEFIHRIIILPSDILIVSDADWVFRSIDNGNTWDTLFTHGDIWIGKNGYLFSLSKSNNLLQYSIDEGLSWIEMKSSFGSAHITSDTGGIFYVCADSVYRSTDKGGSWEILKNGLPQGGISNTWVSPTNEIFATSRYDSDSNIYRSTDHGKHWLRDLSVKCLSVREVSFSGNTIIIAGEPSTISTDNGISWQLIATRFDSNFSFNSAVTNLSSGEFLLGDGLGRLQKLDISTLSISQIDFPSGRVISLIDDHGSIIAALGKSIWKSSQNKREWQIISTPIYNEFTSLVRDSLGRVLTFDYNLLFEIDGMYSHKFPIRINSIVVSKNGTIFTGFDDRIQISTDHGIDWQEERYFQWWLIKSLGVNSKGRIFLADQKSLFSSEDNGDSWKIICPTVNGLNITPFDDLIGTVPSTDDSLFVRTIDNGTSWDTIAVGRPGDRSLHALLTLTRNSFLAATDSGIYRLDSGITHWYPVNNGLTFKDIMCLYTDAEGYVFAGTNGSGIFRSKEKMIELPDIMPRPWISVQDENIEFDTIAVGSTFSKAVKIINEGTAPLILGKDFFVKDKLPFSVDTNTTVFPLTVGPDESVIIPIIFHPPQVANYISEIDWVSNVDTALEKYMHHVTKLHGVAIARSDVKDISQVNKGISIHPNPTSSELNIEVSSKLNYEEQIEIFNELGVKVYSGSHSLNAGANKIHLDTKDLPPAMYLLKIGDVSQSFVKVK